MFIPQNRSSNAIKPKNDLMLVYPYKTDKIINIDSVIGKSLIISNLFIIF